MPHGIQWIDFISDISFPLWGIIVIVILIRIYQLLKIHIYITREMKYIMIGFSTFFNNIDKKETKSDDKECPKCAESIKMEALICRFCNNEELLLPLDPGLELICPICGGSEISKKDGYCETCRKPTLGY